ncbi:Nif11-like leader peptide family RiPP precursor [Scytonema sp. NUACC26]|uniref:Nif11-like leader peptide family RiPP precursor n=1 Tax=Scytonema sp. NUACC26 TaxID=3140176 RepID=UPI0034DBB658
MSVESAKAFYERVATDEAFQKQLRAASDDRRQEIILAAGYSFTWQEWEVAQAQISKSDDGKLSDAQLEAIAGGVGAVAGGQASFNEEPRGRVRLGLKQSIGSIKLLHRLFYPPTWSIGTKLSVALLSVTLIPMSFTTYHNLQESLKNAKDSEYRKLELLATSNASRLDQLIIDIQRVAVQVSTDKDVVGFLASTTPQKQESFRSSMQRTLDNVFRSNPDYDVVYVIDSNGRCLAATDPTFIGQNYAFRKYFGSSIQGRPYVSSILVGKTSKRPGIYFSNPVRSETGKIVGVAVLKIKGEDIWSIVNALQAGSQSHAFLVDQYGVIISHPDKSLLYHSLTKLPPEKLKQIESDRPDDVNQIKNLDVPELAAVMVGAKDTGRTSYYSPLEKTRQTIGFAPLEVQPWVLGVNKPNEKFYDPLNHLIWQNSLSLLAVGAIAAIIALILARSIARPIRALTKAAETLVEQDDFDSQKLTEVSRTTDDIGQLVRVFLQMAQQVKAREQKLKQQVKELYIEIDEAKKARQVAEITQTDYFEQLQKKARKLKGRTVKTGETEPDYFEQLQQKAQKLKGRAVKVVE